VDSDILLIDISVLFFSGTTFRFILSKSFTRGIQIGNLLLAILGAEVYLFFPSYWQTFSRNFQNVEHVLPGLTNEVLFLSSIAILSIMTIGRLLLLKKL